MRRIIYILGVMLCLLTQGPARLACAAINGSGSGTILREVWTGISGKYITDLTSDPDYPDNPTFSDELTLLEAPTNWASYYGTRIRGYVHPPESGDYQFWVAGDDYVEMYLSNSADPAGKQLIAQVPGWTNSRVWDKYPQQQSSLIYLESGQKYYVEVLHKERTGGDNVAVAWERPDGVFEVIPGEHLSPFVVGGEEPPPEPTGCEQIGSGDFVGCYYDNKDFTDLKLTRTDSEINFNWGSGAPDPSMGISSFSIRWQGNFNFSEGNYTFTTTSDDGVRLYVDGQLLIDKWVNQASVTHTADVDLTAGTHLVKLEYYDNIGSASVALSWVSNGAPDPDPEPEPDTTPPSVPDGLTATSISTSQIHLAWNASTDDTAVTGYKLYRNSSQIADVASTSYADTGLTADTTYQYKVRAYDEAGNISDYSAGVSAATNAPEPEPQPENGLLGYWKFDETGGSVAQDSSGNGHDAVISGAARVAGQAGGALYFNGSADNYVEDADGESYINGLESFTVSVWVKSDLTNTDKGFIMARDPDGSDHVLSLRYDKSGASGKGVNVIKAGVSPNGTARSYESASGVQTTGWQHVAFTWSSGNIIAVYINGQLDVKTHSSSGITGSIAGATKLLIGKGPKDQNGSWKGIIDEVRIYNRVLSPEEIAALAGTGVVQPAEPTLFVSNVEYNAAGQVEKIEYGNGTVVNQRLKMYQKSARKVYHSQELSTAD